MEERLANEILDAANNTGICKEKRRYAQDGRSKTRLLCSLQIS